MESWLRLAADAVVLVHLGFVVFVAAGGLLAIRWPAVGWLHVPAVLWGIYIELSGAVCPLTPLENELRLAGGGAAYTGGFIDRYIVPLIYPPGLSRGLQLALGAAVLALNGLLYGALAWRWRKGRRGSGATKSLIGKPPSG